MKLHEIIKANEDQSSSILIEKLIPYKKQLLVYYSNLFNCDPVLMVTDVFNAAQYGIIVPSNEFQDAFDEYVKDCIYDTPEDKDSYYETVNFNSMLLSNL